MKLSPTTIGGGVGMVWVLVRVGLGGRVGEGGVGLTRLPSSTTIGSGVGLV